jgi:hypothetical protein
MEICPMPENDGGVDSPLPENDIFGSVVEADPAIGGGICVPDPDAPKAFNATAIGPKNNGGV